jgi:hypothetical protein
MSSIVSNWLNAVQHVTAVRSGLKLAITTESAVIVDLVVIYRACHGCPSHIYSTNISVHLV